MTYAVDPTQPLPKRWTDQLGPSPAAYDPASRRLCHGASPFCIRVQDLLSGYYTPRIPAKRINVWQRVAEINQQHERAIHELSHRGEE